jgi:ABC-2 type transport system permease protein
VKSYRVYGIFLRNVYLYKRSLPRLMEIFYWPLLDLFLWGFITIYLSRFGQQLPTFVGYFLGALILWDILFRSQLGISISFLEDIWARNFLNLFVSPLTPMEYVFALMIVSVLKILAAGTIMALLAWAFYSFNIFVLGLALIPFVLNLIMLGWAIGIFTTSLILRFGQQAEILAWGIAFLFQPISGVFYPVSVLPKFLRTAALFNPASYVFEGMREIVGRGGIPWGKLAWAFGINAIYLLAAFFVFCLVLKAVKRKGLLARIGE